MRSKHRNDYNHGRDGWIGGNPRYGRNRGHRRGNAPADKALLCKDIQQEGEEVKTLILWQDGKRRPVLKGKVGGLLWDQFLVNARHGHGVCYLIDAGSADEAKRKTDEAKATTIPNVYVLGFEALKALKSQGGQLA